MREFERRWNGDRLREVLEVSNGGELRGWVEEVDVTSAFCELEREPEDNTGEILT